MQLTINGVSLTITAVENGFQALCANLGSIHPTLNVELFRAGEPDYTMPQTHYIVEHQDWLAMAPIMEDWLEWIDAVQAVHAVHGTVHGEVDDVLYGESPEALVAFLTAFELGVYDADDI